MASRQPRFPLGIRLATSHLRPPGQKGRSVTTMKVVVVESPAKAKTINKYLGSGYTVLASFGHVRDLPPKDGSVDPENDFRMLWQVDPRRRSASPISPRP